MKSSSPKTEQKFDMSPTTWTLCDLSFKYELIKVRVP